MYKPVWFPKREMIEQTRLYRLMHKLGYEDYDAFYQESIKDIGWFWDEVAKDMSLAWTVPYTKAVDLERGIAWPRWFVGGRLNISVNALDRFAEDPARRHQLALIWEGDDGATEKLTYRELLREVNRCARGLRELGVRRGDRVALYLPMIVENVVAMLAIARLGAIFTPCFSGYGAEAVATRMQGCEAKWLITADGYKRRGKTVAMKEEADRAAQLSPSLEKVIVVRRLGRECPWHDSRDVSWDELMKDMEPLPPVDTDASEPLMIIYTSGTTGKPKGTVHTHSGFPLKAAFDAGYAFDVGPGDVLFWVTDMGWMMGPWMVFGSLLMGSTMLLYEGTPDYPQPNRLWQLVARHGVTHLGISPTLIRSLMKEGESWLEGNDLSSLRVFGSTGEPWNPEPWMWLFEQVGRKQIPIFNYSGGTEVSGGILGNHFFKPIAPCGFAGPLPGMDADVWDEQGNPVRGEVGELVLRQPWVGMTNGFWQDDDRYEEAYWRRWPQTWVHGDWVAIDEEGQWFITGRSDDTLNIAGKRMGPAEMESVLVDHPDVLEAATIGVPDSVKGECAVCFVVLKVEPDAGEDIERELIHFVGEKMGKALKPKRVLVVDELPKTRNGKILRRVIRSAYLGRETGDLSSLENRAAVEIIRKMGDNHTN
ncbi:AMP-binding protein [Laceyella sacchari]|jgi:acetyl-CoA synthetase|uniref:acetate--CoA ligase n=1 Tax=Laceyella sacchari TaxID=37482 RepID=A0ABY5U0C8_LACSH|nr:AMP-binding protein [Laceyella sacchari]UWE03121.1 AMP-binding protein [Laceyella sacchari]